MSGYWLWSNDQMKLEMINDGGYYDFTIIPYNNRIEHSKLIKLLRLIKSDPHFYKQELIEANSYYTLLPDKYIKLLYRNYRLIIDYLSDYDYKKYHQFRSLVTEYSGL